mgnify:CR=1 FL=1
METKIAFGGGCHWCTEAVFQFLIGVLKVEQGWVNSFGRDASFSEAVIVTFDTELIPLETLIEVHLYTHKSTVAHSFREKYRSAIYAFSTKQLEASKTSIENLQPSFDQVIITKVLPFKSFNASREQIQSYYKKNPNKPFCKRYINPKLELLLEKFSKYVDTEELAHLSN